MSTRRKPTENATTTPVTPIMTPTSIKLSTNTRSPFFPTRLEAQLLAIYPITLLLGSARGGRIDRIGLLADPYVAGSYAEGTYEVTLPVTPAIVRAVKPAYRTAFATGR